MSIPHRVAIVGGYGKVARKLIPRLIDHGQEVVALARKNDQLGALSGMGAIPRHLDLEVADAHELATQLAGCQAVVFAAGGGPDGSIERKHTVDYLGALMTIEAAKLRGIKRLVQVSAIGVDKDPDPERGDVWAAYVKAKRDSDHAVRDSGLDWTILRPGPLSDGPGTGRVHLAEKVPRSTLPRPDLARVIAEVLRQPKSAGHQWEVVTGPVRIADAVAEAATVP
ncbi:SDR family oxidoreductase, partial [Demequina pelophila]|uniref:SDR family oxidoreductase n=1 Tax=Demequina pelophila TaxID=1638984 RepID=UPI0007848113